MGKIIQRINQPVSAAPLAVFRVVFGAVMLVSIIRFILKGWVYEQYIKPQYYFSYYGFEWVRPLSPFLTYSVFVLMALAALGVMLGAFYRWSALLFFLLFTYVELIDKTNYLNHYYFVSLVSFLLLWVPAGRYFSVDVWRNPQQVMPEIPTWCIWIFKLQLGIVYFYAGVAKLNPDWLGSALPLRIWLPVHTDLPLIGPLMGYAWVAYFFSWFGAIYDLSIPFLLLFRRTRPWAYIAVVAFHILTWLLFPIGMFPFIMIGLTIIFFSAEFHESVIRWGKRKLHLTENQLQAVKSPSPHRKSWVLYGLTVYFVWQILFPWRFLLYPGELFWTEEGYRFSWRVMLMEKAGYVTFHIKDPVSGGEEVVSAHEYLTPNQEKMMATQPDMILQFAHFLRDRYVQKGIASPEVKAEAYVTLNGQGSRLYLDPHTNLSEVQDSWKHKTWIISHP